MHKVTYEVHSGIYKGNIIVEYTKGDLASCKLRAMALNWTFISREAV